MGRPCWRVTVAGLEQSTKCSTSNKYGDDNSNEK
jgi:hypothetical protein